MRKVSGVVSFGYFWGMGEFWVGFRDSHISVRAQTKFKHNRILFLVNSPLFVGTDLKCDKYQKSPEFTDDRHK